MTFFWILSCAVVCGAGAGRTFAFTQLVVFGDSLSDVGNVNNQTFGISPGSPYWQGRFSNGPVWIEDLAPSFSLSVPTYSRAGGTNATDWAYGGAHTGPGSITHVFFTFPNIGKQIDNYLAANTPNPNQLFVVWGGGNDFIDGGTNASAVVTNTANEITSLANKGATNIVVPNLPLLGEVPRFRGTANQGTMDSLSTQYNTQLATTLANLKSSLHINIYPLDVQSFFQQVIANPATYGFTNVTQPAYNGSTVVSNADEYLFFDDIHPTRIGHQLLAASAADLINTHNWIAGAGSAAWSTAGNWDPSGAPGSAWIANVANTMPLPGVATLSTSSSVNRVAISGASASMTLRAQNGASLSASSIAVNQNGVIEMNGGAISAGALNVGSGGAIRLDLSSADVNGPAKISVGSLATLAGGLAVATDGSFVPLPGQNFAVMTFGSRSGDLTIDNQTGLAGLRFNKIYKATSLSLAAWALEGDANLDAIVDTVDFNILATSFGTTGRVWTDADFDGDGIVGTIDFNLLAANFSLTTPPEAGMIPVPEPESLALLLLLTPLFQRRRNAME